MENLFIEETTQSPRVDFNINGKMKLTGISTPDHVNNFYEPLFNWVKEFINSNPESIDFEIFVDYLNTSSTRILVEFLTLIKSLGQNKSNLNIVWKYEDDDEDMLELGEEIQVVSGIEMSFISIEIAD